MKTIPRAKPAGEPEHVFQFLLRSMEAKMRFHLKGLLVAAAFAVLLMVAIDIRVGIVAIVAATVIDWLSFALPLGLGRVRDRRSD